MSKAKEKPLTLKQKKFTKEYLKTGNATEAAKRAYNTNDNTARNIGCENLAKPNIRAAVQTAAEKLGLSPEYVLGGIKEVFEFNKQKRVKVKKVGEEVFHEEEMIDAQSSLKAGDLLGKHLKLFTDQIDLKATIETKTDEEQEKAIAKRAALLLMKNALNEEK